MKDDPLCAREKYTRRRPGSSCPTPFAPSRSVSRNRAAYPSLQLQSRSVCPLGSSAQALQHNAHQCGIGAAFHADQRPAWKLDMNRSTRWRNNRRCTLLFSGPRFVHHRHRASSARTVPEREWSFQRRHAQHCCAGRVPQHPSSTASSRPARRSFTWLATHDQCLPTWREFVEVKPATANTIRQRLDPFFEAPPTNWARKRDRSL